MIRKNSRETIGRGPRWSRGSSFRDNYNSSDEIKPYEKVTPQNFWLKPESESTFSLINIPSHNKGYILLCFGLPEKETKHAE